jgi:hypothetical protein
MTGGRRGLCGPGRAEMGRAFLGRYGFGNKRGYGYGFRSGYGLGGGFRRGFCRGFAWYPPAYGPEYPIDQTNELNALKVEADFMKNELDAIYKRIEELEKPSE